MGMEYLPKILSRAKVTGLSMTLPMSLRKLVLPAESPPEPPEAHPTVATERVRPRAKNKGRSEIVFMYRLQL